MSDSLPLYPRFIDIDFETVTPSFANLRKIDFLRFQESTDINPNMTQKIRLLFTIALFCFVSSNAVAIGGQGTSDVKKSIDQTIEYLEQAVAAYDKGEDQKMIIEKLMEAKQVQKSISSANGNLSTIKSKATQKLGQARSSFNDGDSKAGGASMKEALSAFKELKEKYNGMH